MKEVHVPYEGGKYQVEFPKKCVYCGVPSEVTSREITSSGATTRRRRFVTVDVPYCGEHAREKKRNTRTLTAAFVLTLLFSCFVLFAITTSINREPPTLLLVVLAFVAWGLAIGGRELLRRVMVSSRPSMADMSGGSSLGLVVKLIGNEISFAFANDQMADEFARLNPQSSSGVE